MTYAQQQRARMWSMMERASALYRRALDEPCRQTRDELLAASRDRTREADRIAAKLHTRQGVRA